MDGQDQTLYNKCLFRTVSYAEIKSEMVLRSINFSPSDSYYILTLKLRREILGKNEENKQLLKNLDDEIAADNASKHTVGSRYRCALIGCLYTSANHAKYMKHLDLVHHNTKARLACQFKHVCERDFPGLSMLKTHVADTHKKKTSSVAIRQDQLVEELAKLRCLQASCGHHTFSKIIDLKNHLYSHTKKKEDVGCLFCTYQTNTTGSLASHMSRHHKVQTLSQLNLKILHPDMEEDIPTSESSHQHSSELGPEDLQSPDLDSNEEADDSEDSSCDDEGNDEDDHDVFVKALAIQVTILFLFFIRCRNILTFFQFNSWANVSHIAYSTVTTIVKEVFESYKKGVSFTKKRISIKLRQEGLDEERISELVELVDSSDPFDQARGQLLVESQRLRFLSENFPNVKPETVWLSSKDSEIKATYQYVSVPSSLKILLEDPTFIRQKMEDPYYHQEGLIQDVRDGESYHTNNFFKENPLAVPLILFQDELEVS